jgi:hypothetical protein
MHRPYIILEISEAVAAPENNGKNATYASQETTAKEYACHDAGQADVLS